MRVPDGSIFHWVPADDDLRDRVCPTAPVNVRSPVAVWVVPAVNVSVPAVVTVLVKL